MFDVAEFSPSSSRSMNRRKKKALLVERERERGSNDINTVYFMYKY